MWRHESPSGCGIRCRIEELLKAAASGRLKTRADVVREAERMLERSAARTKLRGFFLRWLKLDQVAELPKDAKHFPGFDGGSRLRPAHVARAVPGRNDVVEELPITGSFSWRTISI